MWCKSTNGVFTNNHHTYIRKLINMFVEEQKENITIVYICIPLSNDGGAIKKLHHIVVDGKVIRRGDFYEN